MRSVAPPQKGVRHNKRPAAANGASTAATRVLTPKERIAIIKTMPAVSNTLRRSTSLQVNNKLVLDDLRQNVYAALDAIHTLKVWDLGSASKTQAALVKIATGFIRGGLTYGKLAASIPAVRQSIEEQIGRDYPIDSEKTTVIDSAMRPRLNYGRAASEAVRQLIDHNARVVVKAYDLEALFATKLKYLLDIALVELANDILIGAGMANALTISWKNVVTPHFVYQLDWFLGPRIERATKTSAGAIEAEFSDTPMQYVVVERADTTMGDLLESVYDTALQATVLRALLFQILFSLEAAFDVSGFLHYDLHANNIMARRLDLEAASPYAKKHWMYKRAPHADDDAAATYVVPADEHAGYFVEIIDFGRARAFVSALPPPAHRPLVLVGNPAYPEFGIFPDGARADRSWDVRRLGYDLLMEYPSVDALNYDNIGASAAGTLADDLKEAIFRMTDGAYACYCLRDYDAFIGRIKTENATNNEITSMPPTMDALLSPIMTPVLHANYMKLQKLLKKYRFPAAARTGYQPSRAACIALHDALRSLSDINEDLSDVEADVALMLTTYLKYATIWGPVSAAPGLSPTLILNLPLFAPYVHAGSARTDTVLVGMVHQEDMLADPLNGIPNVPVETGDEDEDETVVTGKSAVGKRAKIRMQRYKQFYENPRRSERLKPTACVVCGHTATGLLCDSDVVGAAHPAEAFCGASCMDIYVGSVLPAQLC